MKMLIIAYYFAPQQIIGAIRPSKIAKYLKKSGNDVTILTVDNVKSINFKQLHEEDLYGKLHRIPVGKFGDFAMKMLNFFSSCSVKSIITSQKKKTEDSSVKNNITSFRKFIKKEIIATLNYCYYQSWIRQCKKFMKYSFNKGTFEWVFSTYNPYETLVLGLYAFKNGYANKWVADFRDTIIQEQDSWSERKRNIAMLKKICDQSNLITTVSRQSLEAAYNILPSKSREQAYKKTIVLYNGFDSDDYENDLSFNENKQLRLSYCGSLYRGKRDLTVLFDAIESLLRIRKIDEEDISISYAGSQFEVLRNQARQYRLEHLLINHGVLEHSKSLDLQANSDAILVATWNEDTFDGKGILTGKVFEAILVKKPVLAIVSGNVPNSELGQLLREYDIGEAFELTDTEVKDKIKMWILKEIEAKKLNKNRKFNKETYNFFHYKTITERLLKVTNTLSKQ